MVLTHERRRKSCLCVESAVMEVDRVQLTSSSSQSSPVLCLSSLTLPAVATTRPLARG